MLDLLLLLIGLPNCNRRRRRTIQLHCLKHNQCQQQKAAPANPNPGENVTVAALHVSQFVTGVRKHDDYKF